MAFKDVKAGLKAAKDAVSKDEYSDVLRTCEVMSIRFCMLHETM